MRRNKKIGWWVDFVDGDGFPATRYQYDRWRQAKEQQHGK